VGGPIPVPAPQAAGGGLRLIIEIRLDGGTACPTDAEPAWGVHAGGVSGGGLQAGGVQVTVRVSGAGDGR
jgi:hypothetical protein